MNAFTPKADVLIKLAKAYYLVNTEIVIAHLPLNLRKLLDDPEVLEWYDRMAQLEYVPARKVSPEEEKAAAGRLRVWSDQNALVATSEQPPANPNPPGPPEPPKPPPNRAVSMPGFQDGVEHSPYSGSLPQNAPQTGRKAVGPLVGYTLTGKHPEEGYIQTYAEARTLQEAADRCYDEFPQIEGFSDRSVKNQETGVETKLRDIPDLVPDGLFSTPTPITNEQIADAGPPSTFVQDSLALMIENDVVDTSPGALSLDDD